MARERNWNHANRMRNRLWMTRKNASMRTLQSCRALFLALTTRLSTLAWMAIEHAIMISAFGKLRFFKKKHKTHASSSPFQHIQTLSVAWKQGIRAANLFHGHVITKTSSRHHNRTRIANNLRKRKANPRAKRKHRSFFSLLLNFFKKQTNKNYQNNFKNRMKISTCFENFSHFEHRFRRRKWIQWIVTQARTNMIATRKFLFASLVTRFASSKMATVIRQMMTNNIRTRKFATRRSNAVLQT